MPELAHLVGSAQRDAYGLGKSREGTGDQDSLTTEMRDDVGGVVLRIEHDEVRVRINRAQHSGVGLVEELLTAIGIRHRRAQRDRHGRPDSTGSLEGNANEAFRQPPGSRSRTRSAFRLTRRWPKNSA